MKDTLKKIDRKFLIIAGCLIGIPVFLILFLMLIQSCSSKKMDYSSYESRMISAAKQYVKKEKQSLETEGETLVITLKKLVDKGYIASASKSLGDDSCDGKVTVRRNGASVEVNKGGYLNYVVSLECDNYGTNSLFKVLKENIVTEGPGLYKIGNEYIFRGDKVHNYVTFFGNNYRIMSVDSNGFVRLINESNDTVYRPWDNKYNTDINSYNGKNIYKDSEIRDELLSNYSNVNRFNDKAKEHIVAYDVCVGKRSYNNYNIDRGLDCSERLEKQLASLINVSDFAIASLDPDCNDISSRSCNNYNYLSYLLSSSWTANAVTENTYEAFSLSSGTIEHELASKYNQYNLIIYIDGNESKFDGIGSELNPYVFK